MRDAEARLSTTRGPATWLPFALLDTFHRAHCRGSAAQHRVSLCVATNARCEMFAELATLPLADVGFAHGVGLAARVSWS